MNENEIDETMTEDLHEDMLDVVEGIKLLLKEHKLSNEQEADIKSYLETLNEKQDTLAQILKQLVEIIPELKTTLPDTLKTQITNPTEEVRLKKPDWYKEADFSRDIVEPIEKALYKAVDRVIKVKIVDSGSPERPVSVRLSDGKRFYKAIENLVEQVTAIGSYGGGANFSYSNGKADYALIDADRHLQVDVLSGGGGGTQYAEDSVHNSGDTGTMALGVRNDAGTALAADGDYVPLMFNSAGALYVTGGGGGTEYVVNDAAPANPTGATFVMERDDALAALTEIEGDWTNPRSTAEGALWTQDFNSDAILADLDAIKTAVEILDNAISGSEMQVDVVSSALPTGAATSANQSTIIGHVDGIEGLLTTIDSDTSGIITSVQLLDDTVFTDDTSTHATGTTKGLGIMAVATPTDGSVDANDIAMPAMSLDRRLHVDAQIVGQDANVTIEGTVTANLSATDNAVLDNIDADLTTIIGHVDGLEGLLTTIDADTGSILTAVQLLDDIVFTDDAAFTVATSKGAVMMGVATSDTVDAGDAAALALDTSRNLKVSLEVDNVGIGGGTEYTEDVATANPQVGKAIMIERDDALSAVTPIEGDWIGLRGTAEGALWVQDFNSDAILADTTAIKTAVEILDNAISGSEMQVDVVTSALPTGAATSANQSTIIGHVDGIEALLGTIDADTSGIITAVQLIDDAIVADDAAFTPATTKVMMAGFEFDDVTPDSVNEGDAGAARMSANRNIYTTLRDAAGNERGANVDASNRLTVVADLGATDNAVLDNIDADLTTIIGHVDGIEGLLTTIDADTGNIATNTSNAATSLAILDDWDNGASDGASVSGDVAHDTADAGEPVKIGHKAIAHGTNPTAVAANDRTDSYANRAGIPFVMAGHPNIVTIRANYTAAQTDTAIVTVGAGAKIVVTRASVMADAANTVDVAARIGFGTANTPTTTGTVLSHPGIRAASGVTEGTGAGMLGVGADNEDLRITSEVPTTGSIDVVISYYTIES